MFNQVSATVIFSEIKVVLIKIFPSQEYEESPSAFTHLLKCSTIWTIKRGRSWHKYYKVLAVIKMRTINLPNSIVLKCRIVLKKKKNESVCGKRVRLFTHGFWIGLTRCIKTQLNWLDPYLHDYYKLVDVSVHRNYSSPRTLRLDVQNNNPFMLSMSIRNGSVTCACNLHHHQQIVTSGYHILNTIVIFHH